MALQITLPFVFQSDSRRSAATVAADLVARCGAWMRRAHDEARLREIEPRMARDMGATPAAGCQAPEGFAMDPRPLWGIGLTPQPMDVAPPWSRGRGAR
jgi:hypothetical protein